MAGLYLHIPFCYSRCGYCDFYKSTRLDSIPSFIDSLKREIAARSNTFPCVVDSIYFGGGTPSLLDVNYISEIMVALHGSYNISGKAEVTIECNPDDVSPVYLDFLIEAGFNRLSLGVQSFNDGDLKIMMRRHNAEQAFKAIDNCLLSGFNNISVDFIYGLPWADMDSFRRTLNVFANLDVQHISAYHLTIEKGTLFYQRMARGALKELSDSASHEQFNSLREELNKGGYIHYEVSNFCKPGFYSRHNNAYWKSVPYLGFGPGSHSYINNKRFWNRDSLLLYNIGNFNLIREEEELSETDMYNEMIMLGLRTAEGVDTEKCRVEFPGHYPSFVSSMNKYCKMGVLHIENEMLKCKAEHWFQVDGIIKDFFLFE